MCFYHDDYAWVARVQEVEEGPDTVEARCRECRARILPGEWRKNIYMQEHDPDDHDPDELFDTFDPGETYDYDRCAGCQLLLDVIRRAEEGEGCRGDETQPGYGELGEALRDRPEYADRALREHPELGSHLGRFFELSWRGEWELDLWDEEDLHPVEELGGEG